MTAPKQRVAWLVVDRRGDICGSDETDEGAAKYAAALGQQYPSGAPFTPVRVTYPWPQKEAKRGK